MKTYDFKTRFYIQTICWRNIIVSFNLTDVLNTDSKGDVKISERSQIKAFHSDLNSDVRFQIKLYFVDSESRFY